MVRNVWRNPHHCFAVIFELAFPHVCKLSGYQPVLPVLPMLYVIQSCAVGYALTLDNAAHSVQETNIRPGRKDCLHFRSDMTHAKIKTHPI